MATKFSSDIDLEWIKLRNSSFQPLEGAACCTCDNMLYMFGGVLCETPDSILNEDNNETNQLLQYDPAKDTWTFLNHTGDIPRPCSGATLVAVDKKLYLFGGLSVMRGWLDDFYMFDTKTNEWSKIQSEGLFPCGRDKLTSCVIGNDIYYFGGFGPTLGEEMLENIPEEDEDDEIRGIEQQQEAANFTWFNDVYKFNTVSRSWSLEWGSGSNGPEPTARAAHSMVALESGFIIFGGRDSITRQNDTWLFSTKDKAWSKIVTTGQLPQPRSFHASVLAGKRMMVFGGRGITNQHFNNIDVLDTETNQWFQPSTTFLLPPAVGLHSMFLANNNVYITGGSSDFRADINSCTSFNKTVYAFPADQILNCQITEQAAANTLAAVLGLTPSSSNITATTAST